MTKNRQSDMRTRKQTCVSQEIDITSAVSSIFSQLLHCFEAREKRLCLHIAPFLFIILMHASSMSSQAECLHITPFLFIIFMHATSIGSQAEYFYFLSQP